MTLSSTLKTTLRASVVAAVLAGTALTGVAPAQAQANPSFGFSLNFGNDRPNFFGQGPRGGITLNFGDRNYWNYCLSDRQIIRGLENRRYRDVRIVRSENRANNVWVVARQGRDWYQMRVNRCTGKVDRVREINRRSNGGFNLNFSF